MITHTNIKLTLQLLLWLLLTWQLLFISPPLSCITTHWLSCIRLIPRLGTRPYTSRSNWVSTSWYSSTSLALFNGLLYCYLFCFYLFSFPHAKSF